MSFTFAFPNPMRLFEPVTPGARLLCNTRTFNQSVWTAVEALVVMSYDHRNLLALKLSRGTSYLLVEEIDESAHEIAFEWASTALSSSDPQAALETVKDRLCAVLREYHRATATINPIENMFAQRAHLH